MDIEAQPGTPKARLRRAQGDPAVPGLLTSASPYVDSVPDGYGTAAKTARP